MAAANTDGRGDAAVEALTLTKADGRLWACLPAGDPDGTWWDITDPQEPKPVNGGDANPTKQIKTAAAALAAAKMEG